MWRRALGARLHKNKMVDELSLWFLHSEVSCIHFTITIISVIVVFYLMIIIKRITFPHHSTGAFQDTNTCSSPNCVRCTRIALQDGKVLHRKLADFLAHKKYDESTLNRLIGATVGDSSNVLRQTRQKPTTLFVHGMFSSPWFNDEIFCGSALAAFADIKNQQIIRQEFFQVFGHLHEGWFKNTTPDGDWFVFHLFNQGVGVEENCGKCPQTLALLDSVELFMGNCAFGNALFSVLLPGTHISRYYGPTNCRVRCHVPIVVPQGACAIVVDGDKRHWKEGKLMLFDDSFLHEAWHQGGDSMGPRVVLMLDLWHPGLTPEEREAIAYLFPPSA